MKGEKRKFKNNVKVKSIAIIIIINTLIALILSFPMNAMLEKIAVKTISEQTLNASNVVLNILDEKYWEEIENMQKSNKITNKKVYEEINGYLNKIRTQNNYKYIYAIYIDENGNNRYSFDADYTKGGSPGEDYSEFASSYEYEDIIPALESKKNSYIDHIMSDEEWGDCITTYSVLIDKDNNIKMVLGIDSYPDSALQLKNDIFLKILLIWILFSTITSIAVYLIFTKIFKRLQIIDVYSKEIEEGNLTRNEDYFEENEIGNLYKSFYKTIIKIKNMLHNFKLLSKENIKNVDIINQNIKTFDKNYNNIVANISFIDDKIEDISNVNTDILGYTQKLYAEFNKISKTSNDMLKYSTNVSNLNEKGLDVMKNLNLTIEKTQNEVEELVINKIAFINKEMNNILPIISGIEDISNQINLLSLNASIEAAIAGEAGKSFGVVADSIRSLSIQSDKITKNIIKNIKNLNNQIIQTKEDSNNVKEALGFQKTEAETTMLTFVDINKQVQEFISNTETLNNQIDKVTNETVLNSAIEKISSKIELTKEESAQIVEILKENNQDLNTLKESINNIQENVINLDKEIEIFKTEK